MFEMACVSLNKIKLHYWASINKNKKAKWLEFLLNRPSYLFGTTLVAVNTVMQLGSEAARRFYEAIHINPDFAPVSQIIIVVIFGELAPLFAARKHSEHVAYLSVPIVYFISRILTPMIWIIDKIYKASNYLFGKTQLDYFLSKEELQKVLEEPTKRNVKLENTDINNVVSNIFSLKERKAKEIMIPINHIKTIPSDYTIDQLRKSPTIGFMPYFPVYHSEKNNIVSIAYPEDLLKASDISRVIECAKAPWFITEEMFVIEILKQFRTNNQKIAIVLDKNGKGKGFITLDQIEDEIFGKYPLYAEIKKTDARVVIEKTLPGDMLLKDFNKKFHANLSYKKAKTINDLINLLLDHHPSEGEVVRFDRYEFTIVDTSLKGVRVKVKSILE